MLFHVVVYGEEEMVAMLVVPTSNWTCAMVAPDSDAVAVSVTDEPETSALLAGAVKETVGEVVPVVNVWSVEVEV